LASCAKKSPSSAPPAIRVCGLSMKLSLLWNRNLAEIGLRLDSIVHVAATAPDQELQVPSREALSGGRSTNIPPALRDSWLGNGPGP
jgi:hypothetical protein